MAGLLRCYSPLCAYSKQAAEKTLQYKLFDGKHTIKHGVRLMTVHQIKNYIYTYFFWTREFNCTGLAVSHYLNHDFLIVDLFGGCLNNEQKLRSSKFYNFLTLSSYFKLNKMRQRDVVVIISETLSFRSFFHLKL